MEIVAIAQVVALGFSVVNGIIGWFKGGTPEAKNAAIGATVDNVINGMSAVSAGGQKETWTGLGNVSQEFKNVLISLTNIAELSGKTGAEKASYVNDIASNVLTGYEKLTTGAAHTDATVLVPIIQQGINNLVAISFPKTDTSVINPTMPNSAS